MRIIQEPKLNFEDVLLCPKRSTLTSRADVKMTRTFKFRNSGKQLEFCPIFASNMDGVGTFSMAKVLQKYHMMTVITKSTNFDQWGCSLPIICNSSRGFGLSIFQVPGLFARPPFESV